MALDKLVGPIKQLLSYVKSCPIIVEPYSLESKEYLIKKLGVLGGSITGSYFGNNLVGQIPLKSLRELEKDEAIKKIRFRGIVGLLKQSPLEQKGVLDNYLVELLSMLESTGIIFEMIDGITEEDEKRIKDLGGMRPEAPRLSGGKYCNFYNANLPLEKIEIFAESSRITRIWYDQPLHGTFVLDTITNYSGGE